MQDVVPQLPPTEARQVAFQEGSQALLAATHIGSGHFRVLQQGQRLWMLQYGHPCPPKLGCSRNLAWGIL